MLQALDDIVVVSDDHADVNYVPPSENIPSCRFSRVKKRTK